MPRSDSDAGGGAAPRTRMILLVLIAFAAVTVRYWRVLAGHEFLPGAFTVVFVPLSVLSFAAIDARVHFRTGQWVAVATVVVLHMVLSVPAFPGPLYSIGPRVLHADHFMHVFAGGVVMWLCLDLCDRRTADSRSSTIALAVVAAVLTLGLGLAKETTDWLSVRATHGRYDPVDAALDTVSNLIGLVGAAVWWHLALTRRARRAPDRATRSRPG